uniref:Uncharacterized protein n=1 Tax=Magnetococcus massalia (strain MO-1) TaxID=451514 RepID=A0A1S7LKF5_MAGMO|nr:protein of unknown function [Candidatus Magnetococcus massalia]
MQWSGAHSGSMGSAPFGIATEPEGQRSQGAAGGRITVTLHEISGLAPPYYAATLPGRAGWNKQKLGENSALRMS